MSGSSCPKRIKKLLNELSMEAHERELARELGELAEKFEEWAEGKICARELSFIVHEYETGPLRELFKFYNRAPVHYRVAYGVVEGFIGEEEIPAEVWPYIEGAIEFYKFRSGDEESSSSEGVGGQQSLNLTRLSPRLHRGGWGESGAGQRYVSGKAAAQLSSTR